MLYLVYNHTFGIPMQDLALRDLPEPYHAMLPVELALRTAPPKEVFESYGITDRQTAARIMESPAFKAAYKKAVEEVSKDGYSIRMKAAMQTEANLPALYLIGQDPAVDGTTRIKSIELQARIAKLLQDNNQNALPMGSGTTINMVFSGRKEVAVVDGVARRIPEVAS